MQGPIIGNVDGPRAVGLNVQPSQQPAPCRAVQSVVMWATVRYVMSVGWQVVNTDH